MTRQGLMEQSSILLEERLASERTRAVVVKALLVGGIVLGVVAVAAGFEQDRLLTRLAVERDGLAGAVSFDTRYHLVELVQLVFLLITQIAWSVWLYSAYANLRLLGSKRIDHTPGWAVGCWFVPIMNLFRPFQILRELWNRSVREDPRGTARFLAAPRLIVWWWATLLSWLIGTRVSAAWFRGADTIDELRAFTTVRSVLDATGIAASCLAIAVVAGIDRRQRAVRAHDDDWSPTAPGMTDSRALPSDGGLRA